MNRGWRLAPRDRALLVLPSTTPIPTYSITTALPPLLHRHHTMASSPDQSTGSSGSLSEPSSRKLYSVAHPVPLPGSKPGLDSYTIAIPPATARPRPVCKPFVTRPPNHTREHFRDLDCPFTFHRLFTVVWILGASAAIFFVQNAIWPATFAGLVRPDLTISPVWSWIGALWLIALPSAVLSVLGNLLFRYGRKLDSVPAMKHNVVFRIVSRGTNAECLLETIAVVRSEMEKNPLFPYLIEVVTDGGVFHAPDEDDILQVVVPMDYTTLNNTLYKARALHFAVENTCVPFNTWVVHLDEETRPTSSGIKGIARMVAESEASGKVRRLGQGGMLYHRSWRTFPFLTLCDMRRTGDDMGHFHLQHRLGVTLFGLHGSFIVCRQDTEAEIGFDLGVQGSITEDAWWILLAMQRGIRTCWVDGYLDEQSTQSLMDFLKQRRRWYVGLWKVSWHCPAPLRYRLFVIFNTVSWLIVPVLLPFIVVYMAFMCVHEIPVPFFLRILTNFVICTTALVYFNGLVANMREHGTRWWQGILWTLAMLLCMPLCYLLEAVSVVMACFYPFSKNAKGFHVVQKSASTDIDFDASAAKSSSEDEDTI